MPYRVVDFASSIQIDDCRVRSPTSLIFLCGGKIADEGRPHGSVRSFFHSELKDKHAAVAQRVRLAEDVGSWLKQTPFADLLELEEYLAHLATVTVLFVESAGSIAELGTFAASNSLRPKTIAVINSHYELKDTFIADGPVARMRRENKSLVLYYSWDPKNLGSSETIEECRAITSNVLAVFAKLEVKRSKSETFQAGNMGHVMQLIADLVRLAGVVAPKDIGKCLRKLGIAVSRADLARCLSLLEVLDIISERRRSDKSFYVPGRTSAGSIRYSYKPEAQALELEEVRDKLRDGLPPTERRVLEGLIRHG